MGIAYNFLWNDKALVIELYDEAEDGNVTKIGDMRLSREEALKFAKQITFYANTKLAKDKVSMTQPTPMPDDMP